MNSLSWCVFAVALASALCAPSNASDYTVKKMPLLRSTLSNFIDSQLSIMDPFKLPNQGLTQYTTEEYQIDVHVSSSERMISGIADPKSWSLVSNPKKLSLDFAINYPEIYYTSNYHVGGSILGNRVSGEGKSRFLIENFSVLLNVTMMEVKPEDPHITYPYLQIDTLTFEMQVGNIASNITGPTVKGVTAVELERVIDQHVMNAIHKNKQEIEKMSEAIIKSNLNMFMKNLSIDILISWLWSNEKTHFAPPTVPVDDYFPTRKQ